MNEFDRHSNNPETEVEKMNHDTHDSEDRLARRGRALFISGAIVLLIAVLLFVFDVRQTATAAGSGKTRWKVSWKAETMYHTSGTSGTWTQGAPAGVLGTLYPYWWWNWWYYYYYYQNQNQPAKGAKVVITRWKVTGQVE